MSKQLLDTASKHSFSLIGFMDQAWNAARDAIFKTGWRPMTKLAESAVVRMMQNITRGQLRVVTFNHIYTFPATQDMSSSEPKVELRVINDVFWVRLATMGDLGFAESYMYGEVECNSLAAIFKLFLLNKENISPSFNSNVSFIFSLPEKLTSYRFLNTISTSRSNLSAHYDISNEMFEGFLSEDMTYSSAIFEDLDGDLASHSQADTSMLLSVHKEDALYSAQMRKLRHIITKARIEPGQRVLEIGSGWGSMAILIVQTIPGVQVDAITPSIQQKQLAEERIRAAGLDGRIRVHLMDYRDMPSEWEGAFDRLVSIEMMEHVGKEFMETYWKMVDWALDRKKGLGVVQVITIPEARFETYTKDVDFIRKWSKFYRTPPIPPHTSLTPFFMLVFPGGFLPSLSYLIHTLNTGSQGKLVVDSVVNIGPHYARTLREWHRRFLDRFDDVIAPALAREYPDAMSGVDGKVEAEIFKRKWVYYFSYCEVGFTTRTLGDHIITFAREGYEDLGCTVFA